MSAQTNHLVLAAFTSIARRVPGRFDRLRAALEAADYDVVSDFQRLIATYEQECLDLERKVRQPWLR